MSDLMVLSNESLKDFDLQHKYSSALISNDDSVLKTMYKIYNQKQMTDCFKVE